MPKRLRLFATENTYLVTQRCSEERFFLEPSPEVNQCIGSWIARGQERYRVKILAYVVMSNHWHFVLRAPENNLARFMAYISGNVARGVNRIHGHHGDVWEDRYSAQPILDDESIAERIEYTEMNPVKAGLCREPDQWCGLSSASHDKLILAFDMVHAREWQRTSHNAKTRLVAHTKRHFLSIVRIRDGVRRRVMDFLKRDPFSRPKRPKRTQQPLCFGSIENWRCYRDLYRSFRFAHAIASAAFSSGEWSTSFPNGSFRPPIQQVVSDTSAT